MRNIVLSLLGICLAQALWAQPAATIDWKADLDYLAAELPAKHYNLFSVRSHKEWTAGIEAIKSQVGQMSDFDIVLKTQQLIATFGDSHTMLGFYSMLDKKQALPLKLYWAADGLYVVATNAENKEMLGQRVTEINGTPIMTVIDSLSTLFTIDNRAVVKSRTPQFMPSLQILNYFGFTDDGDAELALGDGTKHTLLPIGEGKPDIVAFKNDSLTYAQRNGKKMFTADYFADGKIYYMLYNECWGRELELKYRNAKKATAMPSFEAFAEQAFKTLRHEKVDKLIFDLRYNGGGSSLQGTKFIEKLAAFLEDKPNINVYVLVGRQTFSSAILNVLDFKRLIKNARFVGEETPGKPNHFGEVRNFELPGSGVSVQYSTKYFKNSDEQLNTITPDVTIETTFADHAKGIDPVFEWIKAQ